MPKPTEYPVELLVPEPVPQNGPEEVIAVPPTGEEQAGGKNSKAPASGFALRTTSRISSVIPPTADVPMILPSTRKFVGAKFPVAGLANNGSAETEFRSLPVVCQS